MYSTFLSGDFVTTKDEINSINLIYNNRTQNWPFSKKKCVHSWHSRKSIYLLISFPKRSVFSLLSFVPYCSLSIFPVMNFPPLVNFMSMGWIGKLVPGWGWKWKVNIALLFQIQTENLSPRKKTERYWGFKKSSFFMVLWGSNPRRSRLFSIHPHEFDISLHNNYCWPEITAGTNVGIHSWILVGYWKL